MKNPYKRSDLFTCHYTRHTAFDNRVSAYHVLVARKCYPQGCLEFRWSCALLNKGKRCTRGFTRMGRLCSGCSHYRDEKVHYQPCINLTPAEFARFQQELETFDDWIAENKGREHDISLRIDLIRPRFLKEIDRHHARLRLEGYLLSTRSGFIGIEPFEDPFYAIISPSQQERLALAPGDELDARGAFVLDRGRVLFPHLRSVEVTQRSGTPAWSNSRALVAKQNARPLPRQNHKCLRCPEGALVDLVDRSGREPRSRRELICLQGIASAGSCYFQTMEQLADQPPGCHDLEE